MDASVYKRPNKPKRVIVKDRSRSAPCALPELPELITVDSATECHVTPPGVADSMVDYLMEPSRYSGDVLTLEPHGGTGNLVQALYNADQSPIELVIIERYLGLCQAMRERFPGERYKGGVDPLHVCFLEYAETAQRMVTFPRIIMNPPFKQAKRHVNAALSLLGRGGHDFPACLVALVPVTYQHDEAETLETLPNDTFASAKVYTKIVRFLR
ncbi:MAG: methyltransferase type 11 [Pseudomonadota bacterium]